LFSMLPADDRTAAQAHRAWFEELVREMLAFLEGDEDAGAAGAEGDTKQPGASP